MGFERRLEMVRRYRQRGVTNLGRRAVDRPGIVPKIADLCERSSATARRPNTI